MGTTSIFEIPYPEDEDLVTLGANAMQAMAEAIDTAMSDDLDLRPFVQLAGSGDDPDGDFRIEWNTGAPVRTRGAWSYPSGGHVIIPPEPGIYLVTANHHFDEGSYGVGPGDPGVKASLTIEHKVSGADQSTATVLQRVDTLFASQTDTGWLSCSAAVWIDSTASRGIQTRLLVDNILNSAGDTNSRLSIFQLSRI